MAQLIKNPSAMWETWDRSLGWEDPLEERKATHSSILAWRIPWTTQLQRVRHDWATFTMAYSVATLKSETPLCRSKRDKEISEKNTSTLQAHTRVRQRSIHRRGKNKKILSPRMSYNSNEAFCKAYIHFIYIYTYSFRLKVLAFPMNIQWGGHL